MSEEKVIKHAGKAVHIIKNKEKNWLGKAKELAEEIAIIVFAVTITLALHNWNDERHEHKMEKEFLEGIKDDLKRDAENIGNVDEINKTASYYDEAWKQISSGKVDAAYIDTNSYQLSNTSFLTFDNARFEGFKSSGYLRLIENKTLLQHLTYLYMSYIPFEVNADAMFYNERRQGYNTYIGVKAPMDANQVTQVSKIVNDPAVRYQIAWYGTYLRERIRHKKQLAAKMNKMAAEIEEELKKKD
ncbi:hypothetical protein FFF34_000115 [Inquilinus sp. KBS0705]|nr:hypothetical protein FFF34_000115 [Inquilinus sp. KBS0705]